MRAYWKGSVQEFLDVESRLIEATIQDRYSQDGFVSLYTDQIRVWAESLTLLKGQIDKLVGVHRESRDWLILLEVPLYRLRRRIDLIVVSRSVLNVIEIKTRSGTSDESSRRQVEEYALDLKDFHEASDDLTIVPTLWFTESDSKSHQFNIDPGHVTDVVKIGSVDLVNHLMNVDQQSRHLPGINFEDWLAGNYRPVPTVIQAATAIFAGHQVDEIARADAANLDTAASQIRNLIDRAREEEFKALIFLTGTPGSGKTLVGLKVVHSEEASVHKESEVVYLSGNSPLVLVIRESLARDKKKRTGLPLTTTRLDVRTQIQHIIDFLREYLSDGTKQPPYERAIVFDEAQRAWDAKYGEKKFGRTASEPSLLLEIMGRHQGWSVIVCLIGNGQEINAGENGLREWGRALSQLPTTVRQGWRIFGPETLASSEPSDSSFSLGVIPESIQFVPDPTLELKVPIRSYRSPRVADWVEEVLAGNAAKAFDLSLGLGNYPIHLTRSLSTMRAWLNERGRGERRFGLVASSEARRLRGEGLGVSLNANDGDKIAHWYLNAKGDIRSSYSLEVTANQFTCQGLELDFVGLCWGGDMNHSPPDGWCFRRLSGNKWVTATGDSARFIKNSYRVLMTRAREGFIIWVPPGDQSDHTRDPEIFDLTVDYLLSCGAKQLG